MEIEQAYRCCDASSTWHTSHMVWRLHQFAQGFL